VCLFRVQGYTGPVGGPCVACGAGKFSTAAQNVLTLIPGTPSKLASPSTRHAAAVGSTVLPAYFAQGGPFGKGHVRFDRTQTQYLDGGARTFNIASNGGFTVVAVVRFSGSGLWEKIIDFGNNAGDNNIVVGRESDTSDLALGFFEGSTHLGSVKISSAIVQNQWMTIVARYRAEDQTCSLEVNGQQATLTIAALTDRTLSSTWVGRSHWGDDYFDGDIAGLYVTDEYASDEKSALIANALKEGLDLAELPCINCEAGTYSAAAGSTVCTSCEAGKYKAAAGVNIACDQCEAAPRGIAFQRCWIRMPTGCNQALVETQTPTVWFVDPAQDAAACAGRVAVYNMHCSKSDGEHDWRTEEAPPRIVGGKFSAAVGATACDIYKLGSTNQSCNDVCWSLGRSCNLEATRNLNSEQLVRGVLGQLGHSILSNSEWRTDDCGDSQTGWEGQIPFYHQAAVGMYFFCPGAASSKATCAGKHLARERICACGGTSSALDQYPATYLAATAGSWDQSANMLQDISGNRRVGRVTTGSTSAGVLAGNGAGISVPFVEGTTATQILWGSLSVPSTFTICSITRYSGAAKQRILGCKNLNWLHGHHADSAIHAGGTWYGQDINLGYSISPDTDWVIACGRNVGGSSVGTIINGIVTSTGSGGLGGCDLNINDAIVGSGVPEISDWQLSSLHVWDSHLSDDVFASVSSQLNDYLAGSFP
jgi:hypothetical protein